MRKNCVEGVEVVPKSGCSCYAHGQLPVDCVGTFLFSCTSFPKTNGVGFQIVIGCVMLSSYEFI